MPPERVFALLMLIVGALAGALAGSVRSYWRRMSTGHRVAGGDVGSSWFRPLVRN
jgi:hypothetical protein